MTVAGSNTVTSAAMPGREKSAIDHSDRVGRKRSHLADGVLPRERLLIAHVAAEHARERSERARMLTRVRGRAAVAGDRCRRVLQDLDEIGFGSESQDGADVSLSPATAPPPHQLTPASRA
jgi:hypothetical protein